MPPPKKIEKKQKNKTTHTVMTYPHTLMSHTHAHDRHTHTHAS